MFIEQSSTFRMSFVQIAEFDWLPGRKRVNLKQNVKNLLLRNHKVNEADSFHTC